MANNITVGANSAPTLNNEEEQVKELQKQDEIKLTKSPQQYMNEFYKLTTTRIIWDKNLMFYGIFLSELNKEFSLRVPTACVSKFPGSNQIKLLINPVFWDSISENEKIFILCHEIMHVVEYAWEVEKEFGIDRHELFNIAADLSINTSLEHLERSSSLKVIKGAMMPELFPDIPMKRKESSLYYYNLLKNNEDKLPKFAKEACMAGLTLGDIISGKADLHPTWKELTDGLSDIEKEILKRNIVRQVQEVAESTQKQQGILPADVESKLPKITPIKQVLNWKHLFKQFIGFVTTSSRKLTKQRPNKRFGWMPGKRDEYKVAGVVLTDSSGSMSNNDLMRANQELYNIWKAGAKLHFACWDDGVGELKAYDGKMEFERTKCGGTCIDPTLEFIKSNHRKYNWQFAVIITDGYFNNPTKDISIPTMFIISSGGRKIKGPYKQVQINE